MPHPTFPLRCRGRCCGLNGFVKARAADGNDATWKLMCIFSQQRQLACMCERAIWGERGTNVGRPCARWLPPVMPFFFCAARARGFCETDVGVPRSLFDTRPCLSGFAAACFLICGVGTYSPQRVYNRKQGKCYCCGGAHLFNDSRFMALGMITNRLRKFH